MPEEVNEVKAARLKLGLTHRELAEALDVTERTIYRWETEHRRLHRVNAKAIARLMMNFPQSISTREIMDKKILEALKALAIVANAAYWQDYYDCGSDVSDACAECRHHKVCQANAKLNDAVRELENGNKH